MTAPMMVLCAWLLLGGTHLVLVLGLPLRARLARRLGEQGFVAMFSAVAALSSGVLAIAVARFGGDGPAGLALGRLPLARGLLVALALSGLTLAIAGLLNYARSPMAVFRTRLNPAAGIERITRHAFFMGLALFAAAHALLAPTLALCIYFAGFAVLAAGGALLQDRKLLTRHGAPYAHYLAVTSAVPFAALIQRRQTWVAGDRVLRTLALSGALALVLLAAHPLWSAFHGAPLAGLIAVGGVFATARRWLHSRAAAREEASAKNPGV